MIEITMHQSYRIETIINKTEDIYINNNRQQYINYEIKMFLIIQINWNLKRKWNKKNCNKIKIIFIKHVEILYSLSCEEITKNPICTTNYNDTL